MGAGQSTWAVRTWYSISHDIRKNDNFVHNVATLWPLAITTALLSSSMSHCMATVTATVSSGRITSGMLAFASTVVASDTGSDFQNRMLRSRRSPCNRSEEHTSELQSL